MLLHIRLEFLDSVSKFAHTGLKQGKFENDHKTCNPVHTVKLPERIRKLFVHYVPVALPALLSFVFVSNVFHFLLIAMHKGQDSCSCSCRRVISKRNIDWFANTSNKDGTPVFGKNR